MIFENVCRFFPLSTVPCPPAPSPNGSNGDISNLLHVRLARLYIHVVQPRKRAENGFIRCPIGTHKIVSVAHVPQGQKSRVFTRNDLLSTMVLAASKYNINKTARTSCTVTDWPETFFRKKKKKNFILDEQIPTNTTKRNAWQCNVIVIFVTINGNHFSGDIFLQSHIVGDFVL